MWSKKEIKKELSDLHDNSRVETFFKNRGKFDNENNKDTDTQILKAIRKSSISSDKKIDTQVYDQTNANKSDKYRNNEFIDEFISWLETRNSYKSEDTFFLF